MSTYKTSKSKEAILNRIRKSLADHKLPMPFPEVDKEPVDSVFAKSDLSPEEQFAEEFTRLGGKFVFCEDDRDLVDNLIALADSRNWQQVLCADARVLQLAKEHSLAFVHPMDPANETAEASITDCEVLSARTGSVILSSKQHHGRVAPVFYPVHIIIAYPNQVVADIRQGLDFLKNKYGANMPSMINLNTGPSRTADIEKTLVVGVHGPGEVFVFFVNQ